MNSLLGFKKKQKKTKASSRLLLKKIAIFLAFEFIFTAVTMPLLVFFGPFDNVKKVVVGSLFTTFSHKYMVEVFLSQQAIERIIGKDGYYAYAEAETDGQTIDKMDFKVVHTDKIDVLNIEGGDLKGCMLVIHDPTRIKVGYSSKIPKQGETTSTIAKNNGAIAALNAGGFTYNDNWASTGAGFEGFIIHEGRVIGNALKNENTPDDAIGFTDKGQLIFGRYSINDLKRNNVKEAISFFGPQLIVKGKKRFSPGDNGGLGIAPRSAIGQKATGEVIFLAIDGRDILGGSLGASMYDLQEILYAQGVVNAINLDGGSSTTLFYNGKVINKPSNPMGERAIPSVFMVLPEKEVAKR